MSVFKRPTSPNFYAEFRYKGHRFFGSTGESEERKARAAERHFRAEFKAEIDKKLSSIGDPWTLDQCFGKYWDTIARPEKGKLSPVWSKETKRYSSLILGIVDPNMLARDVSDSEVEAFVDTYEMRGAGKYAVNRALSVWRRVHRLSKRRWKQQMQEIDWAEFFNREAKRVASLEPLQAVALGKAAPELADAIEWSLLTGCRHFETYGLEWAKISLAAGKATVIAKGGREHTVWLTEASMDVLARVPRNGPLVFDETNWRKRWDAARNAIGKPELRWHDLRHTHACWLAEIGGAPIEVIQRSLGHADIATTMRYRYVADPELHNALRRLPSLATISGAVVPFSRVPSSA